MKSKKLISLLCVAALSASSFASLTAFAAAGDKIADVVTTQDFNSLTTGMLADGNAARVTYTDLPYLTLVTTDNRRDQGTYTDKENTVVVSGSHYSVAEKTTEDKYLHISYPFFGDYTKNGRYAHADFVNASKAAVTYTADANTDYVIEFDAKFTYGLAKGEKATTGAYDPVLRIGTFNQSTKTADAVEIDKALQNIGDDWVHVKSVTSTKGTKVYLGDSETPAVTSTTKAVNALGFYSADGSSSIAPPPDALSVLGQTDALDADKHTLSPTVDIDNFKIYTAVPEKEVDVTINYVDGEGTALKTARTVSAVVGKTFAVEESDKAIIDTDGDNYYKYTSGGDSFTVVDGTNTVNLVFTSTPKATITFKAVMGSAEIATLATAKAAPGVSVTADTYANEYIYSETTEKWYQKIEVKGGPRNLPSYNLTAVGGEEDKTVTVGYKPANNVVSFLEAETVEGTSNGTYSTDNYPALNASGGKWVQSETVGNYAKGFTTAPVTEAGTYEVTVRTYGNNDRPAVVAASKDGTLVKLGEGTGKGVGIVSYTAELAEGDYFYVGVSATLKNTPNTKLINDVDYIVVKDTSKTAAPAPTVELAYAKEGKTATIKVTNMDQVLEDVKATLIHASYNSDGSLKDIEAYPETISVDALSGTTSVTTETLRKPVAEGDKLMVWDTLGGLKPLLVVYPITANEADDV